MTHRKRLPLRLGAAAAALTAVLAGYAPQAGATRPHASPVQITVWHEYTKKNLDAFNDLIGQFEAAHPTIKVTQVASTNYDALFQKLQSAVFAGNPPTLAQSYESWVQQFSTKNNAIEDLGPYVSGSHGLSSADIKDFYSSLWADGQLNGKRLMMPFSKSDIVLYYNPAILSKYGVTTAPKTWDEFAVDCAKVTQISNGRATQWGTTYQVDESTWYAWEHEWGNTVLDARNKAAFGTSKGAEPVSFFANLAKKKQIVVSGTQNYQDQADFDAGKTAFDIGTSAGLSYELAGAKAGVQVKEAPLPAGPVGRATELFGAPLTMFSKATSEQKQAAWLFLTFITQPAQTAYWSMHTGYMPVRRSALDRPALKAYYRQYPDRLAAVSQLDNAVLEPTLNGWPKAINDIDTQLTSALSGTREPVSAMRQAATQVDADLASAQQ